MLFRNRNKKQLKRSIEYLSFLILMGVSAFYITELPKPIHWTMIVPWTLIIVLFVAWCRASNYKIKTTSANSTRRKVKRYI